MSLYRLPRIVACTILVLMLGCSEDRTAALVRRLGQSDVEARRTAARELGKMGSDIDADDDVVSALDVAARDTDSEVRRLSIYALGQLGTAAVSSLPALTEALNDRELSVRLAAALAMQKIDPDNEAYIPILVDAMRHGQAGIVLEVAGMEPSAKWAVPTLVTLLSHPRPVLRQVAVTSLGEMGSAAIEAEPALQRAAKDDHEGVRQAAAEALRIIQGPTADGP